jgi:phage-related minor tail protein
MTDTRKVQLAAELDASGVRRGVGQVTDAMRDMTQVVGQEGAKASKSIDGIGAGAGESAGRVDKAARSIIGSIERTTAAAKAGEKGTAAYFEQLGQQRGVSADTLKPYLDNLRQAEVAQRAASGSLDKMGVSAKQTAAAMRGVPAQFTDIITSLQGGQAPLTVFLQQGGQLKDMFGGVGAAARALGGFVLGLVNPFTIAAAAAGALAYAYNAGANEAQAFQRTTILSGQVAGVTAGQLTAMASAINSMGAGTQGRAAEVLNSIAGSADIGAGNMQRFVAAALQLEKVGGPAAEETAKAFASLAKEPLTAALKLNEGTNFLTKSVYDQIKALNEQGRTVDAARVAQEAYSAVLEQRTPQLLQGLGYVERAWLAIKDATKGAADAALNVGRGNTLEGQIEAVLARLESARTGIYSRDKVPALRQELALLQEQARMLQRGAESAAQRGASVKAGAEWDKETDKYLNKQAQQAREIAKAEALGLAAGRSRAEIERQIAAIREKYTEKAKAAPKVATNSFDTDSLRAYAKGLDDLGNIAAGANANAEALSKTQAALLKIQADPAWGAYSRQQREQILYAASLGQAEEDRAAAVKDGARIAVEAGKAHADMISEISRGGDAAAKQVQALQDEEAALGMVVDGTLGLRQAVELVTIARLREKQVAMLGNEAAVLALQREIDERQKLASLIGSQDARKDAADAAKEAARDWKRAAESIENSITDALMRGFESGKDFASALRDTVVNMFKSLVLRPIVSAIVNPIAQAATGAMGFSSAASAAGSAAGGAGTLGNLASLGGMAGSIGAFGTAAGYGLSAAFGGTAATAISGGASMIGAGSVASGAGLMIGAAAPYLLAAYAIYKVLSHDNKASLGFGASTLGASGGIDQAERLFGFGDGKEKGRTGQLDGVSKLVLQSIADTSKALGGTAGAGLSVQAASDIDKKGKGAGTIQILLNGQRLGGVQTGGGDPLAQAAGKIEAGKLGEFFAGATSAALIAGLQQSDLPAKFADYFATVNASSLSKEQADAMLATASAAQALSTSFAQLGGSFAKLDTLSVQASEQLLKVFGGIDGFSTAVNSYLQNFYSDAERSSIATKQLSKALGDLGLSLPATREQYRALVDAQDLTTESGRTAYAALISLSGAFAGMTDAAAGLGDATRSAGNSIEAEIKRLRGTTGTNGADLQAQFAIATAQGRAGDLSALQALPGISQSLEESAKASASSAIDVARVRAWLAASLGDTLATVPGFADGGSFAGGLRIVGENGPEAEFTGPSRILSNADTARLLGGGSERLEAQIEALGRQVATLSEAARATAMHTSKTARLIERAMPDGDAIATRTALD